VKKVSAMLLCVMTTSLWIFAADTWTGIISDSKCGAAHRTDARKCTRDCVRSGGAFVLVVATDQVYGIENAADLEIRAELARHAGRTVQVTGRMNEKAQRIKIDRILQAVAHESKTRPPRPKPVVKSSQDSKRGVPQEVALAGWLHVIWNGGPHYKLVDDRGNSTDLLLDEKLTAPFGGPLVFNRKRVKIAGLPVPPPSKAVRVISISLE